MKIFTVNKNINSLIEFISNNLKEILITSFIISLIFSLSDDFFYVPFILLFAAILYKYLSEKTFVLFSIIILISFTGEPLDSIRDYFTIIAIAGLFFFFLKRYGLVIETYPKPTGILLSLWFIFLFTISFITFINGFHLPGIDALFRSTVFFAICYFLYAFIEEKDSNTNYYYLLLALIIATLILSATVYYELFSRGLAIFLVEGFFARFAGAYGNFNTLAFLLSIGIIISLVALYSEKITREIKLFFIPIYIFNNAFIIFLTNSRASILTLTIALLFLFYHLNKKVILLFIFLVFSLILLYLFDPFTQALVDAYIRLETVSQRDYLWAAGIEIMKDYPIFGVGTEMFPFKFYTYVPTSGSYMFELFRILQKPHPHNYSLWLITENGILGMICALSLFGFYFFMAWKLLSNFSKVKNEVYYFSLGFMSIGIMVFVRSFFEVEGIFSYGYISRDLPFWITYILLAYFYKYNIKENPERIN